MVGVLVEYEGLFRYMLKVSLDSLSELDVASDVETGIATTE